MQLKNIVLTGTLTMAVLFAYSQGKVDEQAKQRLAAQAPVTVKTAVGPLVLQPPFKTASASKSSRTINWPEGVTPKAPEGFTVTCFADQLNNPRWTYIAPNGDYFVAEAGTRNSANQITLLRDIDKDGNVDERYVFINNLNRNFG